MTRRPSHTTAVIIPAHNEAGVLARTLTCLLRGAAPGELDVIVVANGCEDDTAAVARMYAARVVETPVPGKSHAIRLGDDAASTFPRLYLDADVELTIADVRCLVRTLRAPGVLATAPVPHYDLAGVRPIARRLLKVHDLLMADRRGLAGTGAYCLTEAGHARIAPFPDVISDDGYVQRSFGPTEQRVSADASSVVRPAATFAATLRRRVRVRQGNGELDALGLPRREGRLRLDALLQLVRHHRITPLDAACYLALLVADRAQVRWSRLRGSEVSWGTDTSSRGPAAATS